MTTAQWLLLAEVGAAVALVIVTYFLMQATKVMATESGKASKAYRRQAKATKMLSDRLMARDEREQADRNARVAATRVVVTAAIRSAIVGVQMTRDRAKTNGGAAVMWQARILDAWPSGDLLAEAYQPEVVVHVVRAYTAALAMTQNVAVFEAARTHEVRFQDSSLVDAARRCGEIVECAWNALPQSDRELLPIPQQEPGV